MTRFTPIWLQSQCTRRTLPNATVQWLLNEKVGIDKKIVPARFFFLLNGPRSRLSKSTSHKRVPVLVWGNSVKHRYTAYRMGRLSVAATLGDGGVNDTWKERKGTFFGSRNLRQYCAIAPAVNCRQCLPVFGIQENICPSQVLTLWNILFLLRIPNLWNVFLSFNY
jgi:hypothetical protein